MTKTHTQKGSIQKVEAWTGNLGDTVRACRDEVKKAKAQIESNLARDVKGNKKVLP